MNCTTGTYSQLSSVCQKCPNKYACNNKRLEAVAYLIPKEEQKVQESIVISMGGQSNHVDIIQALIKAIEKSKCGFLR